MAPGSRSALILSSDPIMGLDRRTAMPRVSRLVPDGVAKHPDAFDLDLDTVAVLHEDWRRARLAYARRRPHDDQIARLQGQAFCKQRHRLVHREDHVPRIRVLHDMAVEPRLERQPPRAGRQFVRAHESRAERAGAVEILADRPLRGAMLIVANAGVVETRISGDVTMRIRLLHVARSTADNRDEFGLIVEL